MLSMEARLKRDKLFGVGDIVTIRSVRDMVKEYGFSSFYSNQPAVLYGFTTGEDTMEQYCGKTFKIVSKTKDSQGYSYKLNDLTYMFSSDMFELPKKSKTKNVSKTNSSAILEDFRKSLIELREKINKIIGEN